MLSDEDMAQIRRKTPYPANREYEEPDHDETMRLRSDTEAMYENEEEGEGEDDYDYDPKMEKVTTVLAIVAGIVICIILIVLAVKIFGGKKDAISLPARSSLRRKPRKRQRKSPCRM